jgi:hypothetical protein
MLRNSRQPEIVRLYSVLDAEGLNEGHPAHAYFARPYRRSRGDMQRYLTGHMPDPAAAAIQVLAIMDGLQLQWPRDLEGFDLLKHWRGSWPAQSSGPNAKTEEAAPREPGHLLSPSATNGHSQPPGGPCYEPQASPGAGRPRS